MKKTFQLLFSVLVITAVMLGFMPAQHVQAVSTTVVISQVYGGGGNTNAIYTNDFIELYNLGSETVSLAGWSVQYASASGTGNFGANTAQITPLSGSIAPGQYILIREAAGSGTYLTLPSPDITDSTPINISGTGGKVALVNTATSLGCNGGSAPCSAAALAQIVDLVGWDGANFYETAPALATTNSTAVLRNGNGSVDTDNNSADFTVGAPFPRNSLYPFGAVGLATPASVEPGETALLTVTVTPGIAPVSTEIAVTCDLSPIGGLADQAFFDDGTNGDIAAADNVFSFSSTDPTPGTTLISCDFSDAEGRSGTTTISVNLLAVIPIGTVNGPVADADNGTAHVSPYVGQTVTIKGVIFEKTLQAISNSADTYKGFYIQNTVDDADTDPNTSDGLFVFMNKATTLTGGYTPVVGDEVVISGTITEYYNMTELQNASMIRKDRTGVDIEEELPPVVADPPVNLADANRYWERLQGMRVQVPENSIVLGGRSVFNPADAEVWVAAPDSTVALREDPYTRRAFRDANPLDDNYDPSLWDGNGYRILMGSLGVKAASGDATILIDPARTFDTVLNTPAGGLNYTFSKYRIEISEQPEYAEGVDPAANYAPEEIVDRTTEYSITDYNLENLYDYRNNPFSGCDFSTDTGCPKVAPFLSDVNPSFDYVPSSDDVYQARLTDIANQIVFDLFSPDILMVQEVENQDICVVADASLICGTTDNADGKPDVLQELALKILEIGGPAYESAFDRDSSDLRGIAPAFLFRSDRVELLSAEGDPVLGASPVIGSYAAVPYDSDVSNPKTLNAVLPVGVTACETAWVFPRAPDIALFRIYSSSVGEGNYADVYAINNHFKSGPDTCIGHRTEQAKFNAALVGFIQSVKPEAQVVVGGDLNVYPRPDDIAYNASDQLGSLYNPLLGLKNLWEIINASAPSSAYSYVYLGMAQTLDQMIVNQHLLAELQDFRIAHINSDFPADYPGDVARGTSDHDPNVATYMINDNSKFITGSGWFKSPVDGYKVKFDVVARYRNDAIYPEGDVSLILGNKLTFLSTHLDWLVVAGNKIGLQGTGTLNGTAGYSFLISEVDDSPDKIQIKIWNASGIVYDTGALVNIGGGNISIK